MSGLLRGSVAGLLVAVLALAIAWLAFDLLVIGYGESPHQLIVLLVRGTWGTAYGIGQVLYKATPLLFGGIAVSIALRAGLFNVGVEGQMSIAALGAAVVAARLSGLSPWLAVPIALAAAAFFGALWAAPAALLRARRGVHEVIATILLNRVADGVVTFLLAAGLALPASVRTPAIAPSTRLARLETVVPALAGSAVSYALPLGVALLLLWSVSARWTRLGRELEQVAQGPEACAAEHIPVARRRFEALVLSGAVAGLAASATVFGYKGAFEQGLGAGAGFISIAVALLGRGSFGGLLAAALLLGTLQQGGLVINARVPMEIIDVVSAVLIVAVAIADRKLTRLFGALDHERRLAA
ncbi:MAG: ABC transporter permease [Myxococcales bacterium]|nr:ABC transporter permease [Myxococcales bacterium]